MSKIIRMRFAIRTTILLFALSLCAGAWSQSGAAKPKDIQSVLVHAGRVLDVRTGNYLPDSGILIENGRIRFSFEGQAPDGKTAVKFVFNGAIKS